MLPKIGINIRLICNLEIISYIGGTKYNLIIRMKIQQIQALTLTLDCSRVLLITGLCNMQTVRTAEMADVECILFVRGKKITPAMLQVAAENNMILMETCHSMYHAVGELYSNGLLPVY